MNDEDFMKLAIEEAKKGYRPFGAIVVKDNKIIVRTHNTANSDPTAHAETNAIREACNILKTRDLSGCTLYASCEPCAMCFTAALWARISKIVFGAYAKDVPEDGWKLGVDCSYLNNKSGNRIEIKSGVLREESLKLFQ